MKKETDNSRPGSLMIFLLIVLDKKYLKVLELKDLSKKSRAIIRTGECSPYSNIILTSGVIF